MAKYCEVCGAEMDEKDIFCNSCRTIAGGENIQASEFQKIEKKIKSCRDLEELESLHEQIEKNYDGPHDREYLLDLLDISHGKINAAIDSVEMEKFESQIKMCDTVDKAVSLKKNIDDSRISCRGKYALMRQLKVHTSEMLSNVIELGKKMNPKAVSDDVLAIIGFAMLAGICYAARRFFKMKWIVTVSRWGIYVFLGLAVFMLVMLVVDIMKWAFSSKAKKEASRIVMLLKEQQLYFDKGEYIFFDSDIRYLRPGELPTNLEGKFLAGMEIYARHGEKFQDDAELRDHFGKKSWYIYCPEKDVKDSELNKYEVANYNLLRQDNPDVAIKYIE